MQKKDKQVRSTLRQMQKVLSSKSAHYGRKAGTFVKRTIGSSQPIISDSFTPTFLNKKKFSLQQ